MGVGEPDVLPGLAGVKAAVDAVARQDVAANARLAGADEDEVGVRFATATAPTDADVIWKSVTGCQLSPPSVVFQRPPPVAPK